MFKLSVDTVLASSPGVRDMPAICILVRFCSIERINCIRLVYRIGGFKVMLTVVDFNALDAGAAGLAAPGAAAPGVAGAAAGALAPASFGWKLNWDMVMPAWLA